MKRIFIPLLLGVLTLLSGLPAFADNSVQVSDQSYHLDFPKTLSFNLKATSAEDITDIVLLVRFPNSTTRLKPKFTPGKSLDVTADWNLGTQGASTGAGGYLPPGASGEYSWSLTSANGTKTDTKPQPFRVTDNRFQWQTLENDRVAVNWYGGSETYGKAIFDKANSALDAIQQSVGAKLSHKIQVFLWDSHPLFMSAISAGQPEWAGGTIDETFGIVLMDGGDEGFAITATPHEITHLVLHAAVGNGLGQSAFPRWMDEGLAVYHEYIPAKLEPRFQSELDNGIKNDSLFRLRTLASNFPGTGTGVELAYAQSYAAVDYMIRQYGRDKMQKILQLFHDGVNTDDAFQQVLGLDTDGLDNAWRVSVGLQARSYSQVGAATPNAIPTFALSSAETPGAQSPATATTQAVANASTPAPAGATPTPQTSGNQQRGSASTGLCGLFGGFALAMVGVYSRRRRRSRP